MFAATAGCYRQGPSFRTGHSAIRGGRSPGASCGGRVAPRRGPGPEPTPAAPGHFPDLLPLASVAGQQLVPAGRAVAPHGVLLRARGVGTLRGPKERVNDLPRPLDLVPAHEQRRV